MSLAADILSWTFLVAGGALCIIGALGLLRMPDLFSRMHGAGIVDTLGMGLVMLGLMFQGGFSLITVKLIVIVIFIVFTSPTATHAVAKAALHGGVTPKTDEEEGSSSKTS